MSQVRRRRRSSGIPPLRQWHWHWRSLAATVYMMICLTDFMVMPIYREYAHNKLSHQQIMADARSMEGSAAQIEALRILREDRPWTPLTNDVFHLAFGAILGVSALPMNRRRPNDYPDDDGPDPKPDPDSDTGAEK